MQVISTGGKQVVFSEGYMIPSASKVTGPFETNSAAVAAGLVKGDLYYNSSGVVRVVL